jgi:hypothetical protein
MRHQFEYKGICCPVDVHEGEKGEWTWSYQIASGAIYTCRDLPLDKEETALREAKRKVKWTIDHKK